MRTLTMILVLAAPFLIVWLLIAALIVTIGRDTRRR